jgi:hypothetical protein
MQTVEKTFGGALKVALNYELIDDDISMSGTFMYEHNGFSSVLMAVIGEQFPSLLYKSSVYDPKTPMEGAHVIHNDTYSIIGCKNNEMLSCITIPKHHMDEFTNWFADVIMEIAEKYRKK